MKKVFILFFLFYGFTLIAQEKGQTQVFTLSECLKIARQKNPRLKVAEANISTAGAEITSAFGNFLPSATFNMGYTRQLNVEAGQKINIGGQTIVVGKIEPNSYNMSLSLNYNLFDGFNREAQYNSAKEKLNSAFSSYSQTISEIEIGVYRAYINALRLTKILEARRKDFELGQKELERVRALFEAGSIPITNVLSQEAELANKEILIIQAENDLKNAKAVLLSSMGMEPDINIEISEKDIPLEYSEEEITQFRSQFVVLEKVLPKVLSNRKDLLALEQQITASQANLTIARANYFPTLSAYGGWSWANNEFNKFSELGRSFVGLALRVPIFENFKTNYQIELAKAQIVELETQKLQLVQNIKSQLIQAINNLDAAEKQLSATKKSVEAAEKNFQSARERYNVGSASVTDYLLANNLLVNAQINQINAIYGYYLAQKELLYTIGLLTNK
ncbi:TolC family protein [Bacteroidetes/Chlorobi group bacterium MS-B_bin-24]|jgi:outer membrane protein|nr:MAG: TolC family protein [Bacteroidetes/Chlorobi group bacterium MS-B_bin-24]